MKNTIIWILGITLLTMSYSSTADAQSTSPQEVTDLTYLQKKAILWNSNPIINIELHQATLEEALIAIAKQAKAGLYYDADLMPEQTVSLEGEGVPLAEVLKIILEDTQLEAYASGRNILLREKQAVDSLASPSMGSDRAIQETVRGQVVDAQTGEALPGVNILLQGTSTGTSTDADGEFELNVSTLDETLVVSFIGYETQEINLDGRFEINVELISVAFQGDEVVVVGYGSQRREDITSAVSVVDIESVRESPMSNLTSMLQGQAPGVIVRQTDGTPGSELEVKIRGISSLGAGSEPLYVIDGFPVGTSAGQNIDPSDIESITVLKDAASTAIYGARGSNGVILITTKSAREGEVNVSFNMSSGIQNLPNSRRTEMMDGVEFAQFKKEAFMDRIRNFENREPSIEEVPEGYRYPEETPYSTDWFDEITNQNAGFQNYNISVAAGQGAIRSLVSVGYVNERGAIIETGFERFNVRGNFTGDIHEKISFGWNIVGSFSREQYAPTTGRDAIIGSALWADPRDPVYNEDGVYNAYIGGRDGVFGTPNPVMELTETDRNRNTGNLSTNGYLEFSIMENLGFRSSVNASVRNRRQNEFRPSYLAGRGFNNPPPREAFQNESYNEAINYSTDQLLTYILNFGDHDVTATAGFSAQEEKFQGVNASGDEYPNDIVRTLDTATRVDVNSFETDWSLMAYFGRLNYNFRNKYLVSATYRREGSSRFGANNRWGNFPAASLGWRLSEEAFMPEITWLADLKFRGSWGITGNNSIGNYSSLATMSASNYIIDGSFAPGQRLSSFANPELGWEQSNQINFGLDVALFDNKLDFTVEFYEKITNDMLLPVRIPVISGFQSTFTNIGKVENKGLEFAVGYRTSGQDFSFRSNFNIAFNRNKVLEIGGEHDEIRNGGMYGPNHVSRPGRPIGMLHGFRMLGIFNSWDDIDSAPPQDGAIPGVFIYEDTNGDGVVSYDTQDMVEIGNPHPDFTWGLTLGADYKRFDLNVLVTGAQGYDLYKQILKTTLNMDGVFNILRDGKDRWRSPDDPGNGIIPTSDGWQYQREANSRYVYDASHAWIKNVTVGYTLPTIGNISHIRVYLSADNLFLLSNYPGANPEVNQFGGINPGVDDEVYPVPRTFSLGAVINF
ncbi:MAG: TonB-dependent receptor [Balneolaceae bacterium]